MRSLAPEGAPAEGGVYRPPDLGYLAAKSLGRASGFAVSYGAGSLWVVLLGWTIDHLGFGVAFWIMAASFLAAAAVLLAAGREPVGRAGRS